MTPLGLLSIYLGLCSGCHGDSMRPSNNASDASAVLDANTALDANAVSDANAVLDASATADAAEPTDGSETGDATNLADGGDAGSATNQPPTIEDVPDQWSWQDTAIDAIVLNIQDPDDPLEDLTVSVRSNNADLVPETGLNVENGPGEAQRTLTVIPRVGAFGRVTISVTVSDPQGATASTDFVVSFGATAPPVSNAGPVARPFVSVFYHTFLLEASIQGYATYIPVNGPDYPPGTSHPGYYYFHPEVGFTDEMILEHARLAKPYGIDAFSVSFDPAEQNVALIRRIGALFEQVGMRWFLFTESAALKETEASQTFAELLADVRRLTSYVSIEGRPVVHTYDAMKQTTTQLQAFRQTVEDAAGPIYLIGDLLAETIRAHETWGACPGLPWLAADKTYAVQVRLRATTEGVAGTLGVNIEDSTQGVVAQMSVATTSETYAWEPTVWHDGERFTYGGVGDLVVGDYSTSGLRVDAIRIVDPSNPAIIYAETEAEDVPGGGAVVVDDPSAGGGRAVELSSSDPGYYAWWQILAGHRDGLDDKLALFDAISTYGMPGEVSRSWDTCLTTAYDYVASRDAPRPFVAWAGPGFRCDYVAWCTWVRPYGPNGSIFQALLSQARQRSNWVTIRSWNEFFEGTCIEPTEALGSSLLEALSSAYP